MFVEALLALMLMHTYPGESQFSVEKYSGCNDDQSCDMPEHQHARYSDFYESWVVQESYWAAAQRYQRIAEANIRSAQDLLCMKEDGKRDAGCVARRGERYYRKMLDWTVEDLVLLSTAVAIYESGFREDVMVGRGHAKKASMCGGRGRGPGGDACLMQIHPSIAWKFAPDVPEYWYARAKAGDSVAREQVLKWILGGDPEPLGRCFGTGQKMLIHTRRYCETNRKVEVARHGWVWSTVALYGTGSSCSSANSGKTGLRVSMFQKLRREYSGLKKRLENASSSSR